MYADEDGVVDGSEAGGEGGGASWRERGGRTD